MPEIAPIYGKNFSIDGEKDDYYTEYDETENPDDHTETPWEDVPARLAADNHTDLNGYMRFLKTLK